MLKKEQPNITNNVIFRYNIVISAKNGKSGLISVLADKPNSYLIGVSVFERVCIYLGGDKRSFFAVHSAHCV
jgi:hypothetical protein